MASQLKLINQLQCLLGERIVTNFVEKIQCRYIFATNSVVDSACSINQLGESVTVETFGVGGQFGKSCKVQV